MGAMDFGLALVTCLTAAAASSLPVAAWMRLRDRRFLAIAGANLCLFALGVLWIYGQLVANAPASTHVTTATAGLTALASLLLLVTGLVPRSR